MNADPRYPVGRLKREAHLDASARGVLIGHIAHLPGEMRAAVHGLTDDQLDTPYREGGWTVRQVLHHVPDSHLNAYVRTKLALTETTPIIKPYDEGAWAKLPDTALTPPGVSLTLLDALHARWVSLLHGVQEDDWARELQHPHAGHLSLADLLQTYAWHGRHHVAHVTALRERMGW